MAPGRLAAAAFFGALAIIVGSIAPGSAAEPPASGDLFDVSRGTVVTSNSDVSFSVIEAMFGFVGGGPEPTVTFFSDGVDGTVHFVEWSTTAPVTLAGINLHAIGDLPTSPERRTLKHFLLQAKVGDAFQTVYESDIAVPYTFLDGQTGLVISAPVTPIAAQEFRAEFTQNLSGQFYGPRVVELDAFPDALCGDANYSGTITASDALVGLAAGVGSAACPRCICDVNSNGLITASDALATLQASVAVPINLVCEACFLTGATTTTLPATTTTTLSSTTTTSTTVSTTTTTLVVVTDICEIDSATCTTTPCSCGPASGVDYHLGATGRMSGPEGSEFRVNINAKQGGQLDCGGWTRIFAADAIGCDDIGCCRRDLGQPELATWNAFEAIDTPCFCPSVSGLLHNYLLLCLPEGGAPKEVEQTTDPCP